MFSFSWLLLLGLSTGLGTASPLRKTPFGIFPSACVMEAPVGAVVEEHSENKFLVSLPDNQASYIVSVPAECAEYAAVRESQRVKATNRAVPNGWLENAGAFYSAESRSDVLTSFTGSWNVPAAPTKPHVPETLYYFIGLEDRTQGAHTSIHQPVLTWGDETDGGTGGWHIWSWTCCPKNVTWHSKDINGFKTGDTIYGSIQKTDDVTWVIDSSFKSADGASHNTTLTSRVGNYFYNYADVTLEVYNVTSCEQMSDGTVTFQDLALTSTGGKSWIPSTWYTEGAPNACGTDTKIIDQHNIAITVKG